MNDGAALKGNIHAGGDAPAILKIAQLSHVRRAGKLAMSIEALDHPIDLDHIVLSIFLNIIDRRQPNEVADQRALLRNDDQAQSGALMIFGDVDPGEVQGKQCGARVFHHAVSGGFLDRFLESRDVCLAGRILLSKIGL